MWLFLWKPNIFVCENVFLIHIFVIWRMKFEVFFFLVEYDFDMGVLSVLVSMDLKLFSTFCWVNFWCKNSHASLHRACLKKTSRAMARWLWLRLFANCLIRLIMSHLIRLLQLSNILLSVLLNALSNDWLIGQLANEPSQ